MHTPWPFHNFCHAGFFNDRSPENGRCTLEDFPNLANSPMVKSEFVYIYIESSEMAESDRRRVQPAYSRVLIQVVVEAIGSPTKDTQYYFYDMVHFQFYFSFFFILF